MIDLPSLLEPKMIDLLGEQIHFYRKHLDIFIEDYYGIKLYDPQKIVARAIGNCTDVSAAKSRGFGKTWLVALCCHALCVLYPGTPVAVVSGTARQATLVLQKLETMVNNEAILRELDTSNGRRPVQVSENKGIARFKNGSKIESFSVRSIRGQRAKIVVVDESPEVDGGELGGAVSPIKNYRRDICYKYSLADFPSKVINISSACEKTNHFYEDMYRIVQEMHNGSKDVFAIALDYRSAARCGITEMEYFEKERKRLHQSKFDMEYGTIFLGAEANSMYPYNITEACRTAKTVEMTMPKNSTSQYVIGVDLATSEARGSDNAVIVVLKLMTHQDGSVGMSLVNMRSYNGRSLDYLANEVRQMYVRFPNTIKIVFDHRGLGDSFPRFMDMVWTNPDTGVEYPPFICDDERAINSTSLPLLRSIKATNATNQTMATALRVALEQRSLTLPVSSRNIINGRMVLSAASRDDGSDEQLSSTQLSMGEQAIFIETDALQFEMGNIVAKKSQSGNYLYDVARPGSQHKDRYSALAMAVMFVAEVEAKQRRRYNAAKNTEFIGLATNF